MLLGDRLGKLFFERHADFERFTKALAHFGKTRHQLIGLEGVLHFEFIEELAEPVEPAVDLRNGGFRTILFECRECRCLRAVEQHERTILLVCQNPVLIVTVFAAEIHQSERMVGIFHGTLVFVQSQPADAPVIILNELPVDLGTDFRRQLE